MTNRFAYGQTTGDYKDIDYKDIDLRVLSPYVRKMPVIEEE